LAGEQGAVVHLPLRLARLKLLLAARGIRSALGSPVQSVLAATGFLAFSVGIWWGCRWLIGLAHQVPGLGPMILDRFLYLAFLTLFFGLTVSSAVTAYFHLYRSREVRQWIHWPMPVPTLIFWKGLETWILSSWAFLLVGWLMMLAYAQAEGFGWGFFLRCFLYFVPFSLLTSGLGVWVTLLLARWVTNRRRVLLWLGLVLAATAWLLRNRASGWTGSEVPAHLAPWLPYFWLYSSPWLPSSWLTEGLLSFKVPGERGALLALALLASHALLAWDLLCMASRRLYLASWDRQLSSATAAAYLPGRTFWDRAGRLFLGGAPAWVRVIALRDLKRFWRDPVQWPQGVITFGILGIYFANLRTLAYDLQSIEWKVLIAFLNFVGLSLSLVSLNIRFLYPEMTLELRQLWTLGLSAVPLPRLFRVKCLLRMASSYLVVCGLLGLSNAMLRLDPALSWYLLALMAFLVFPLVAIPLGLGACFPQVREDNPLKMVSGLGGALAFIFCFFEALLVLGALAFPFAQVATGRMPLEDLWGSLLLAGAVVAALCLATGWLALRIGGSALRRVEPLLSGRVL